MGLGSLGLKIDQLLLGGTRRVRDFLRECVRFFLREACEGFFEGVCEGVLGIRAASPSSPEREIKCPTVCGRNLAKNILDQLEILIKERSGLC